MKTVRVIAVVCGVILGTAVGAAEFTEKTFPTGKIRTVAINHTAGDVEIVAGAPGVMSIQSAPMPGFAACQLSGEAIDSTYQLTTTPAAQCQLHLKITVPKTMAIDAKVAVGAVDLRNLEGKLNLNLGEGAVSGMVDLKAAKIIVANGPVMLTWLSQPKKGSLDFRVARGDVLLKFPQGSAVDTNITPKGTAGFTSQVPIDAAAPFKISGTVGTGNIAIRH